MNGYVNCSFVPSLPHPSFFRAVENNGAGKPGRKRCVSHATNVTQGGGFDTTVTSVTRARTYVDYPQIMVTFLC